MRKWTACIVILGVATIGVGLLRAVARDEGRIRAEEKVATPFAAVESARRPTLREVESDPFQSGSVQPLVAPSDVHDPFQAEVVAAVDPDRVRSRDPQPASRPRQRYVDHEDAVEARIVHSDPDPPHRKHPFSDEETEPVHAATNKAASSPPNAPRVRLALTPDHQIQVVAAGSPEDVIQQLSGPNGILITAEKFQLTPSAEPGSGNHIVCSGAVEIQASQLTASGMKLSIIKGELVLEGTPENPAVVTKTAAPAFATATSNTPPVVVAVPDPEPSSQIDPFVPPSVLPPVPNAPGAVPNFSDPPAAVIASAAKEPVVVAPVPEFRVSASRITFTLNLDRLQVGNATVIAPASPAAPPLPEEVKAIEPPAVPIPKVHSS